MRRDFYSMKRKINTLFQTALIMSLFACSTQVPTNFSRMNRASLQQSQSRMNRMSQARVSSFSTNSAKNKELILLLKQVYKQNFADDVITLERIDQASKQLEAKGVSLFKMLHNDMRLREIAYPLSAKKLIQEFTKPSPKDAVPPLSSSEVKMMKHKLKPGDVILCGNNKSFVHAALYTGSGQIIHSLATQPGTRTKLWGVVREPLEVYFNRSPRDTVVILRPKNLSQRDFQRAHAYAKDQVGKPYDTLFLTNLADKFYCTELVYHAIRRMQNGPRVSPHPDKYGWHLVTNEDFMDSPDFQTVWERNYKRPPVGQLHRY